MELFIIVIPIISCLAGTVSSFVQQDTFRPITDCVCPQDIVTYECTVCGLATAWEGTALDSCSGGEIALTNRDFMDPIERIICSGGRIAARGVSVEDGCFTSRLNLTFNATLEGRSVICSVDNGTHAFEVGSDTLILSTDPYPPPENVYLASVSPAGLLFSWNQTQNCPSLRYNIRSGNCGQCPNTTDGTSVGCSDFTVSNSVTLCTFAVQAVICGNNGMTLFRNFSDSITVNLTVPAIDRVTTIPHYHLDNGLRSLTVLFSEVNPFDIYEDINGIVTSYKVYYSDSNTGVLCHSKELNSLSCDNGVCSDEFNASLSSCRPSSDINVTVSVVTNLGEGPRTFPILEEYRNNFVRVQVLSEPVSINCTFLSVISKRTVTSCNAMIVYGDNCEEQMLINGVRDSGNDLIVVIALRDFLEGTVLSTICGFRINATASTRTVTVDGNLVAISVNNPSNRSAIVAAALVPIAISIVAIILGFSLVLTYFKISQKRQKSYSPDTTLQSVNTKLKIITVPKECNMIDFAKDNFDRNYNPDSGNGYYQFIEGTEEYIPPKTRVALVSEDKIRRCPNRKARKIIGISDKREKVKLPNLTNTEWKYAFIQSTSRLQILSEGSLFMYYKPCDHSDEPERPKTPLKPREAEKNLRLVEHKYVKLKQVPADREYSVLEFAKTMEGVAYYNPGLGYGFYEFTKPDFITYDKQVILMDKKEKLYYGPDARRIGVGADYDEAEERMPNFDTKRWKRVFVQTRSNTRKLQPNTWFLYCDVASSEMIRVLERFEVITVPEQSSEDERKIIKFAKRNIPYYSPKAGYAYYELTGCKYVIPDRNIMALNRKGELYTGPGVRKLVGVDQGYDETKEVEAPDLTGTEWECIFIQGRLGYGRVLKPNTRFLYCEYDYTPESY